jgi:hypothetical protein
MCAGWFGLRCRWRQERAHLLIPDPIKKRHVVGTAWRPALLRVCGRRLPDAAPDGLGHDNSQRRPPKATCATNERISPAAYPLPFTRCTTHGS